jgi:hypothetical protein
MEALFDEAGEALAAKLIDRSLKGDMAAMRLCLKVMFPAGRKRGDLPRFFGPLLS